MIKFINILIIIIMEEPINKCFNDLFGVRIIFNYDFSFDDINNVFEKIKSDYDINLKCIDSSKKDYVATHIYFKIDNYNFPWELQIWSKKTLRIILFLIRNINKSIKSGKIN